MFKWLKKKFHRHLYEFIGERIVPASFVNSIGFKDGKPTSSVKDVRYRKTKYYRCKICGRIVDDFFINTWGGKIV